MQSKACAQMRASYSPTSGNISVNNIISLLGKGNRVLWYNTPIKPELNISWCKITNPALGCQDQHLQRDVCTLQCYRWSPKAAIAEGARLCAWQRENIWKSALVAPNASKARHLASYIVGDYNQYKAWFIVHFYFLPFPNHLSDCPSATIQLGLN